MATRRGASIGLIIALTMTVGGALVWDRIYRLPPGPGHRLPRREALLVIEHGGVPPGTRQRRSPSATRRSPGPAPPGGRGATPVELKTHVVQEGESLSSIARSVYRRASRWPEIARANGLSEPFRIRAGQTLTIP